MEKISYWSAAKNLVNPRVKPESNTNGIVFLAEDRKPYSSILSQDILFQSFIFIFFCELWVHC